METNKPTQVIVECDSEADAEYIVEKCPVLTAHVIKDGVHVSTFYGDECK